MKKIILLLSLLSLVSLCSCNIVSKIVDITEIADVLVNTIEPLTEKEEKKEALTLQDLIDQGLISITEGSNNLGVLIPEDIDDDIITNDIVIDYVNLEAPVVASSPEDYILIPEGTTHNVVIPKINLEKSGAVALNEEIYNLCEDYYSQVLDGMEDIVVKVNYEYRYAKDLVGIFLTTSYAPFASGYRDRFHFFYYDVANDCKITYYEYLDKLGITNNDIWNAFIQTEEYQINQRDLGDTIYDCIADENSIFLSCQSFAYNDTAQFTVETNLLNKN